MTYIRFNGSTTYGGDPISSTPKIELDINSINPLSSARITVDNSTSALTLVNSGRDYFATFEVTTPLSNGTHAITIEAFAAIGVALTYEVYPLYVQATQDLAMIGAPLAYPNPFDPGTATSEIISYTLSKPANITLSIHDLSGVLIARKSYAANENGGRAGYNAVAWNGKSDAGNIVGNGIYLFLIVADGRVAAKGKLTVLKR